MQAGITKQVVAKVSAGYETLKFPFSDGTQESNKRVFQDYVLQYQPTPEVTLQAGYKMGVALNGITLSAAYAQWKLTGFKNNGVNGVTGNQGAMLTYSIPFDGNTNAKPTSFGALTRPELIGNGTYNLRDAATRPVQLPQAFLAKVDTTAVKTLASVTKAGLPAGAKVNAAGDVMIVVGIGASAITQATRNGAPISYDALAKVVGTDLVLYPTKFPAATSGGDAYVFSVTDLGGTPYFVKVAAQN